MPPSLTALAPLSPQEIIDLTCEDTSTDAAPWSSLTIIDLTEDTCSPPRTTGGAAQDPGQAPAASAADTSRPQLCSTTVEKAETTAGLNPASSRLGTPTEPSATTDRAESGEIWGGSSPSSCCHSSSCSPELNCSTTTFNSDLGSLASMQLDSDLLALSPSSPDSSGSWRSGGREEETPHLCQQRELPARLSPAPALPTTPGKAWGPLLEAGDLLSHEAIQQVTPARTKADSKAWLNRLHCFRRSGAQHLFLQGVAHNMETQQVNGVQSSRCQAQLDPAQRSPCGRAWSGDSSCSTYPCGGGFARQPGSGLLQSPHGGAHATAGFFYVGASQLSSIAFPCTQQKPELIPSGKLSMVRTTMEENFLEGTLDFLNEFVSCQHRPPKEIISYLIRQILLKPHQGEMLKDTYMLLMKIQMYVIPLPQCPRAG